jgi:hypothetical protein
MPLFILGLDFAWSQNGYVYHTKFDNVRQIPLGTLQRTGENILALTLGIANSDKMANTKKYASGNLVFFDFLGAFVVRWSEDIGLFINTFAVAVSVYCLFKTMKASITKGERDATYFLTSYDAEIHILLRCMCTERQVKARGTCRKQTLVNF